MSKPRYRWHYGIQGWFLQGTRRLAPPEVFPTVIIPPRPFDYAEIVQRVRNELESSAQMSCEIMRSILHDLNDEATRARWDRPDGFAAPHWKNY
jgi:hypothetical protein